MNQDKAKASSAPVRPLGKGRSVRALRIGSGWRLIGAEGRSLFFLAEESDGGGELPVGVVQNQLTPANLFGHKTVDGETYTVVAHGGSVEMDKAAGYAQKSA